MSPALPATDGSRESDSIATQMAFRSHSTYVRAFALEAGMLASRDHLEALARVAAAARAVPSFKRHSDVVDYEQVRRSLTAAWSTELLLAITAEVMVEDELIRVSNNWAVIQAYYAVYHATQALHVARGCARPENHQKTQNLYRTHWVDRRIDLAPWSLAVQGRQIINEPAGRDVDLGISNLVTVSPQTQLSLVCKALATTWSNAFENKLQAARSKRLAARVIEVEASNSRREEAGRPVKPLPTKTTIPGAERERIMQKTRPTSLIDYLYRLRIKANYQDGEMFIVGPDDDLTSGQVLDSLRYLIAATLLLHEINIGELVGFSRFHDWQDEWVERARQRGATLGLAGRSILFEPF